MKKEILISSVIIIMIVMGNIITQNYTAKSVKVLTDDLKELKGDLSKNENEIDADKATYIVNKAYTDWSSVHDKMAYYIEHDELEKVETNITAMKSFVESGEYAESISELDKTIFVLKHIEDKYAFNLQNIF